MMVKETNIVTLKEDLATRVKIYRAWLDYATGDGQLHSDQYVCFYHYMKHTIGAGLSKSAESACVGRSASVKPGDVSFQEIEMAEKCGVFTNLKTGFSKYQAVAWGNLCCKMLFASYGVKSSRLIDQLDLSMIIGDGNTFEKDGEKMAIISRMLMESKTLSEICMQTGMGKAQVFAYIWVLR